MNQINRTPSQHELRAELEKMVVADLLGPAGGEHEEITERSVRDRYLVGVLAPSHSGESEARPGDDDEEDDILHIPDPPSRSRAYGDDALVVHDPGQSAIVFGQVLIMKCKDCLFSSSSSQPALGILPLCRFSLSPRLSQA